MTAVDDTIWPKLDRYLAGECSSLEAAEVREWLAADPDGHEAVLRGVRRVRDVAKQRPLERGAEDAWRLAVRELGLSNSDGRVPRMIATDPQVNVPPSASTARRSVPRFRRGTPRTLVKTMWYSAAGVAVGAAVALTAWNVKRQGAASSEGTAPVETSYATGNGQRANITLADGSTVSLNVASRLDVPADYGNGDRTVRLNGEALFSVAHHGGAPFTVIAGAATARVLGTTFAVRHYATDTATVVAVRDGRVAVRSAVLTAAQQAEVGRTGAVSVRPVRDGQFSFATGMLSLPGMSLSAAIPELDRWYDADIRLGDASLTALRIKGKFAAGSLADLAAIMELTFDVRVVRDGRVLTIYPGKS